MENNRKNSVEPSDFLKKLHSVVTSGDPTKGLDVIKKINEIHKLADGMDGEAATSKFNKRVEEAGVKEELTVEERKVITIQSEKEKIKREEEELKLKMMADIKNSEYELNAVNMELDELQIKYEKLIETKEEELSILKIKYEAKFGENDK